MVEVLAQKTVTSYQGCHSEDQAYCLMCLITFCLKEWRINQWNHTTNSIPDSVWNIYATEQWCSTQSCSKSSSTGSISHRHGNSPTWTLYWSPILDLTIPYVSLTLWAVVLKTPTHENPKWSKWAWDIALQTLWVLMQTQRGTLTP
jgi:hypothetical protein